METQLIESGDQVRSYDFPERKDCFIEGIVMGTKSVEGCDRYVLAAFKQVVGDVVREIDSIYYPPVNGTPKVFGGVCDGVELIAKKVKLTLKLTPVEEQEMVDKMVRSFGMA